MAVRLEFWEALRGRHIRYRMVTAQVVYRNGPNGESYPLQSGNGRILRRDLTGSIVTAACKGKTPATVKADAKKRGTAARAAQQAEQSRLRGA
jgi:hypothetical protein